MAWGGVTPTYALPFDSPAINAANNALCPELDQRGVLRARTTADPCDIGAYERIFSGPPSPPPPPNQDTGTAGASPGSGVRGGSVDASGGVSGKNPLPEPEQPMAGAGGQGGSGGINSIGGSGGNSGRARLRDGSSNDSAQQGGSGGLNKGNGGGGGKSQDEVPTNGGVSGASTATIPSKESPLPEPLPPIVSWTPPSQNPTNVALPTPTPPAPPTQTIDHSIQLTGDPAPTPPQAPTLPQDVGQSINPSPTDLPRVERQYAAGGGFGCALDREE